MKFETMEYVYEVAVKDNYVNLLVMSLFFSTLILLMPLIFLLSYGNYGSSVFAIAIILWVLSIIGFLASMLKLYSMSVLLKRFRKNGF